MSGPRPETLSSARSIFDVVHEALVAALGPRAATLERDAPLGARTTYRVGGRGALAVEVDDEDDLAAVHRAWDGVGRPVPVLVVGEGSNMLVADAGFPGLVVRLGPGLGFVEVGPRGVRAGGGAKLPVVARRSAAAGLRGLEWAVGVPGSVGGALRMNAGGHGSDVAAVLDRCRVFDLRTGRGDERAAPALALGYRRSGLAPEEVVVWAAFALTPGDRAEAERAVAEVVRWRRAHQPGGSNAGSVFTNPDGDAAGRLVEAAGLKGFRLGTARVSPKHANFIQADEDGSADDVRALIEHVRAVVAERTGVSLVPEVRLVGFGAAPPPAGVPPTGAALPPGDEPSTSTSTGGSQSADDGPPAAGAGGDGAGAAAPPAAGGAEAHTAGAPPEPAVHPRLWQRRVAVLRDQSRRRLRWVVAGVVVLGALLSALLTLHTPLLAVRHATVEGAAHSGTPAVLRAAGLTSDPPLIDVDPRATAAKVERLPWVDRAVVVRHWPDSVTIRVTERVPVGAFARPGGAVAVVDDTGRVLAWEPGPAAGPALAGPEPPGAPGSVVAPADRPAVTVASELPAPLAARVGAVTVNAAGAVTLSLGGGVRGVLGDTASLHQKLLSLASVLAATRVRGPAVIDVSVPDQPTVGPPGPA